MNQCLFEREGRGGLDFWPSYSKIIPASRSYVDGIFAVPFYLKTGPFMISGYVKNGKHLCIPNEIFFLYPQSIYMSLPMILNQWFAVTSMDTGHAGQKRIAPGFEP